MSYEIKDKCVHGYSFNCPYPHDKEEEKYEKDINSISSQFPKVTPEEISFYIKGISSLLSTKSSNFTKSKEEIEDDPFVKFFLSIDKSAYESKEFQRVFYMWKQALHLANRTTGLMSAFDTGVLIGYFLAKPEAFPETEEGNEKVM